MKKPLSLFYLLSFLVTTLLVSCQDESTVGSRTTGAEYNSNSDSESSHGRSPHAGTGSLIEIDEAARMTLNYQSSRPDQPAAHFIGAAAIQDLLEIPDMIAVRWVLGYTEESEFTIIIEPLLQTESGSVVADDERLVQTVVPEENETPSPYFHGEAGNPPALSSEDGSGISLAQAQSLMHTYRQSFPEARYSFIQGRDVIEGILSNHPTPGLWLYVGQDEAENYEVLVTSSNVDNDNPNYSVADRSSICPPDCYFTSSLLE